MLPASKRTELVTLKTSQLTFRFWLSVIFHSFDNPISILNDPGPRSSLRCPDSPGYASRNWLTAAFGSVELVMPGFWTTFGPVPPPACEKINWPVFGFFPTSIALDSRSQLVGQL